jgi:hypothetical protein
MVGMVAVPSQVDTTYLGTALDITHFIPEPLTSVEEIRWAIILLENNRIYNFQPGFIKPGFAVFRKVR